jgi:hypothetical protein
LSGLQPAAGKQVPRSVRLSQRALVIFAIIIVAFTQRRRQ